MGRIFFGVATLFLFLAAIGSSLIPNPTAWGLVMIALGLLVGNWAPWPWPKRTP